MTDIYVFSPQQFLEGEIIFICSYFSCSPGAVIGEFDVESSESLDEFEPSLTPFLTSWFFFSSLLFPLCKVAFGNLYSTCKSLNYVLSGTQLHGLLTISPINGALVSTTHSLGKCSEYKAPLAGFMAAYLMATKTPVATWMTVGPKCLLVS